MGTAKSVSIVKCLMVRDGSFTYRKMLNSPVEVIRCVKKLKLSNSLQEEVWAICLNSKLAPQCASMISKGSTVESIVDIPAILRAMILSNSIALVLVHNHPSGIPDPSDEDLDSTKRVTNALAVIGFRFVDHIIQGDGKYYSIISSKHFTEEDLVETEEEKSKEDQVVFSEKLF